MSEILILVKELSKKSPGQSRIAVRGITELRRQAEKRADQLGPNCFGVRLSPPQPRSSTATTNCLAASFSHRALFARSALRR